MASLRRPRNPRWGLPPYAPVVVCQRSMLSVRSLRLVGLSTLGLVLGCTKAPSPSPPKAATSVPVVAPNPEEAPVVARGPEEAARVAAAEPPPPPCPILEVEVPEVPMGDDDLPVPEIVDPQHLTSFFERAAAVLRGRAEDHVRIAVYGDSNLTMDFLTGQMRRTLQQAYGDAGHGFVSFGRPWSHYKHMDVRHNMGSGWQAIACSTDPVMDRLYGLAGIAAESMSLRARSWVETAPADAPIGRSASHFDLFYLKGKRWGRFDIEADGEVIMSAEGHAPEVGLGHASFELPDGPHRVEVIANDKRHRVRVFGLAMERGEPSFVVDSFGVGSMNTASQARENPALNREMLKARGYDLIVFATGANDVFTLDVTPGHLRDIIAYHREVLPEAPVVFVTPADRGKTKTLRQTLDAIAQRHEIAKNNQAALWDLFAAMGGEGSMRQFYRRGMSMADHVHFNERGGTYMGLRFTHALWRALEKYVETHPEAGCGAEDVTAQIPGRKRTLARD